MASRILAEDGLKLMSPCNSMLCGGWWLGQNHSTLDEVVMLCVSWFVVMYLVVTFLREIIGREQYICMYILVPGCRYTYICAYVCSCMGLWIYICVLVWYCTRACVIYYSLLVHLQHTILLYMKHALTYHNGALLRPLMRKTLLVLCGFVE